MTVDFENKRAFLNAIVDSVESSNPNDYFWYDRKDDRINTVADIRRKKLGKRHITIETLKKNGYIMLPYIEPNVVLEFYSNFIFTGYDEIVGRIKLMQEEDAFEYVEDLSLACGFSKEMVKIDDYIICNFLTRWCKMYDINFTPINICTYENFLKTKDKIYKILNQNGYLCRATEQTNEDEFFSNLRPFME